jgi:serine protease AprX
MLLALTALAVPAAGVAGGGQSGGNKDGTERYGGPTGPVVPSALIAQALANPNASFRVIVQGKRNDKSSNVESDVAKENGTLSHSFRSIVGVATTITGRDLIKLTKRPHVDVITLDKPMGTSAYDDAEMWRQTTDVESLWNTTDLDTGAILGPAPQAPTVAIIDSGVDASKVGDFGSRVLTSMNFCSLCTDGLTSTADLEGHGTMVAGMLAGANAAHPGVAQNAPIVSLRTANQNGQSMMSDVIAAADWVLANKDHYNIKVVNLSLAAASPTSFRFDPLDQAVERLWFSGITVVAAAGNFGTGSPVDMSFAPGNDPFVITVGATDQTQTSDPLDDTIAPWSAYGFTADGFSKPDVVAPGRFLVMPVPAGSTIPMTVPDRVVAPGYMWMSGTSFSAPIVAGAAAQIIARHPDWGPDQVKGALMLTASYLPNVYWQASGVGEIDAAVAASLDFTPPNPNENLVAFVAPDPVTGLPTFDQAAWASAVSSSAAWSSAAWSSAAWGSAAWASAAWASAAWSSGTFVAHADSAMSSLATYAP